MPGNEEAKERCYCEERKSQAFERVAEDDAGGLAEEEDEEMSHDAPPSHLKLLN